MPRIKLLRARQQLGKYRIEKRLAIGPRAVVYSAYDTIHGVKVALKIPDPSIMDEDFMDEFRREGASLYTLQPAMPNIDALIRVRAHTDLPLSAYSVSTELSLICGAENNLLPDKADVAIEYYSSLLRAGADSVMSYVAIELFEGLNADSTGI